MKLTPQSTLAVLLLGLVLTVPPSAQPLLPQPGRVFDRAALPTVRIAIPADTLAWILAEENQQSDREWRADFEWADNSGSVSIPDVGFRLRGNTSRAAAKKSWKVAFNAFTGGGNFLGVEKLNLNGEHNDPSLVRSALAWSLVRDAEVVGSRSNFVRLEINGADFGVYANVEHVDENFLAAQLRDPSGVLYKCLYPADLADLGDDPAVYRDLAPYGRPVYELKQGNGDHTDLVELIAVLNRTPSNTFPAEIEKVMDVNGYLRTLAMDVLSGNWDGYAYNQNNYYLYNDPEIGVFRFIPYDLDNTLGVDFLGRDWGTRNVYDWPQGSNAGAPPRPLAKRLLLDSDYRARYSFYLNRLIDSSFRTDTTDARISALRAVIDGAVQADPYRPQDYGWTYADYEASFNTALGGHVAYGLRPFISTRRASALSQVSVTDVAPILSERRISPLAPQPGETVRVRVWVEDEEAPAAVRLYHRVDGGSFGAAIAMIDEGNGIFGGDLGPFNAGAEVGFFIEADDVGGRTRIEPRRGSSEPATFTVTTPVSVGLVINEFMASNATTIADDAGEFDDWIEIYNTSLEPISLAGLFITDAMSTPDKFALPDTTIAPGGHLIVWADDDAEQGPMHATFKLSAGGEDAAIFGPDGVGGLALIDGLTYGPQTTDVSFGRQTDGGEPFVFQSTPTPGAPNLGLVDVEIGPEPSALTISIAPNPVRDEGALVFQLADVADVTIEVFDTLGRRVQRAPASRYTAGQHRYFWRNQLGTGVYLAIVRVEIVDGPISQASQRFTVVR